MPPINFPERRNGLKNPTTNVFEMKLQRERWALALLESVDGAEPDSVKLKEFKQKS